MSLRLLRSVFALFFLLVSSPSSFVTAFAPPAIGCRSTIALQESSSAAAAAAFDRNGLENLEQQQAQQFALDQQQHNSQRRQFLSACATAAALAWKPFPAHAAKGNSVSFSNVKNGDTVPRKFLYKFEVTGYELSPAADGLKEGTGHHHLVIDGPKTFVDKGTAIPFDATHKHYGKAQSEGELELEPGKHKLTLQFANALHESYGKEFAKTITVNVKDV